MKLQFEWDEGKAKTNLRLHGVRFDLAKSVFRDAFAVERIDDRKDYGEERFIIIGRGVILFVAYTEREDRIRIISARRATQIEENDYFRQNA